MTSSSSLDPLSTTFVFSYANYIVNSDFHYGVMYIFFTVLSIDH